MGAGGQNSGQRVPVGDLAMGFYRSGGVGSGGGGGSGGPANFISPKAAYNAMDAGKFLAENGTLKRVDTFHQDGHAKTVGGAASPGLWISLGRSSSTADGNSVHNGNALDEGGGSGAHFRGWHHRASDVSSPQDGDFYVSVTYGDFEVFRDGMGTDVSGWYGHNPFQPGEYWETVPNPSFGGDNPLDVSSDGAFDADSLQDAFNHATRVGEAFVIKSERLIVVAGSVSAAQAEYTHYSPKRYVPNERKIVEFWGFGQTEAFPTLLVDRSPTNGDDHRYRFAQENPISLTDNGGIGVTAINASDVPSYRDLLVSTETILDQQILRFEPGLYSFLFQDNSTVHNDISYSGFLYLLRNNTDDLELEWNSGYSSRASPRPPFAPDREFGQVIIFNRIFRFESVTFLTIILSGTTYLSSINGHGYLHIEKIN